MELVARVRRWIDGNLPAGGRARAVWGLRHLASALSSVWSVLLGVAIAIVLYCSAGHDDSHITYWSAYALVELGEIVNHSGARVEQSSSLLHTLVLALAYALTGARLPWLGWGLGIVFAVLTVVRLPRLGGLRASAGPLRLAVGTAPVLTYWALGGLETTLFCWVSVEFLIAAARLLEPRGVEARAWIGPALWSALLAMTRPEASLVVLCALTATVPFAWWRARRCGIRAASLWALNLGLALLLMKWRLEYFGDAFPHPVIAKVASTRGDLAWQTWLGARQMFNLFLRVDALVLLGGLIGGVAGLWRDVRARDVRRPLVTAFAGAYVSFIVCSGGDWMLGGRFLAHIAPVLALLGFVALDVESWPRARAWLLGSVLALANLWGAVSFSARESMGRPIWVAWQVLPSIEANAGIHDFTWVELVNKPHGRDAVFLAELDPVIDRVVASEGKVSLLSVQAGMVMYYLAQRHYGHLEFVDQAGLVSRHYDPLIDELRIPHARLGLDWTTADVLSLGQFRDGPEFRPDVVFDLYGGARNAARRHGYAVIFVQDGTLLSEYTEPEDEEEPEEEVVDPSELTAEERTVLRLREKFEKEREQRDVRFFTAKKGFFQFIAIRRELAEKVGWTRRELDEGGVTGRYRTRYKRVKWDEIRGEHLRYFEDEDEDEDEAEVEDGAEKAAPRRRRPKPVPRSGDGGEDEVEPRPEGDGDEDAEHEPDPAKPDEDEEEDEEDDAEPAETD